MQAPHFLLFTPTQAQTLCINPVIREKWFLGGASDTVSSRSNGSRCYPRASSVVRGQSSRWLMVVGGDKNRETRNRMTGQIPEHTATAPFTPVLCSHRKLRSGTCEFRNGALYEKRCHYWTVRVNGPFGGYCNSGKRSTANIKRGLCERNFILVTHSILLS